MKKPLAFVLAFLFCLSMAACTNTQIPETTPATQPDLEALYQAFLQDLSGQAVYTSIPRLSFREDGSAFLMSDITNNNQATLVAATVFFAAFDQQGAPVPLISNTSQEYVKAAKLPNLSLQPGETSQSNMGLRLTEGFENICYVVTLVDTYTDSENNTVQNPLSDTWLSYYNNKTLEDFILAHLQANDPKVQYQAFLAQLQQQEVVAVNPRIIHEEKNSTLLADLRNDTQQTLSSVTLLFAAFDDQGNPIPLMTSTTGDTFVKRVALTDLSIAPGQSWQADMGLRLSGISDRICHIFVLAETWTAEDTLQENPLTDRWLEYFNEAVLASYMTSQ